jgi:hypothetical protein
LAGYSIDANLDINGDGFQDLLISDPSNPSLGLDNQYALFGGDFLDIGTLIGTPADDTQIGTPLGDVIYALEGSDVIISHGGRDLILAGSGSDAISVIDARFRRIDGGIGVDSLQLEGQVNQDWNFSLNTAAINPAAFSIRPGNQLRSIEVISSQGYGANTLQIDAAAINAINNNHTLFLTPDATDSILLSGDLQRDSSRDTVYAGLRWNAFSGSTTAALLYVAVPSSETALTPSGENAWLASHVSAVRSPAAAAALSSQPSASSEPADPLLPSAISSEVDFGRGLRLLSYKTFDASDRVRFVVERFDTSSRQLVAYASTPANSSAEAGRHYTPVAGLVIFKPGEARQEITVPINSEAFQRLRGARLSLQVEELPDLGQMQERHLLFEPAADGRGSLPVLSGFGFAVDPSSRKATLSFRADANNAGDASTSLSFAIAQRSAADAAPTGGQSVAILDAVRLAPDAAPPAYNQDPNGLALDTDGSTNAQVRSQLTLDLMASGNDPALFLSGPDLVWSSPASSPNGSALVFDQNVSLSAWRADQGSGAVSFALVSGGRSVSLLQNASGGVAGAITPESALNPDPSSGWRATEGLAVGGQAALTNLDLTDVSWTPTASLDGRQLGLQGVEVDGSRITAAFEGGVTLQLFLETITSTSSAVSVRPQVDIQRLAGQNNGLGFYAVDTITGQVDGLNPGDGGYLDAALARAEQAGLLLGADALPGFGEKRSYLDLALDPNRQYGVLLLVDGSRTNLISSFAAANRGGAAQMVSLGSDSTGMVLGIEDLDVNGGRSDGDFNDIVTWIHGLQVPLI